MKENTERDTESTPGDHRGGGFLLIITVIVAILSAVLVVFSWFDVYHRIEQGGRTVDLCHVYAALARSTAQQDNLQCPRN